MDLRELLIPTSYLFFSSSSSCGKETLTFNQSSADADRDAVAAENARLVNTTFQR